MALAGLPVGQKLGRKVGVGSLESEFPALGASVANHLSGISSLARAQAPWGKCLDLGERLGVLGRLGRGTGWLLGWIPLTGLGLASLCGIGLALYWLGLQSRDLVVLSLASGYLGLHLLLALLVCLRALWLRYQLSGSRLQGVPEAPESGLLCRWPGPLPPGWGLPLVQVDWSWVEPLAESDWQWQGGQCQEQVRLARRGQYTRVVRRFRVSDTLGLSRIQFSRVYPGTFRVLPWAGRLGQQPVTIRLSSGEDISDPRGQPQGDRVDMRQYSKGDSPRTILWKVYARTRRLMVRVPERALSPRPKVCAYLVTSPADEAAAALCRVLLERQALGTDWRFGCDGLEGYDHDSERALDRLARSGASRRPQPEQLAQYLRQAQLDGYAQGVIVAPLDLAGQDQALHSRLLLSPIPVQLFLAVDGASAAPRQGWRRWVLQGQGGADLQQQLRRAASLWSNFPGAISVVDRQTGEVIHDLQVFARRRP